MCTRFFRRHGLYVNRPIKRNLQLERRASLPLPKPRFIFLIHIRLDGFIHLKKIYFCPIKNILILCFHRVVKTSLKTDYEKRNCTQESQYKALRARTKVKKKQQQNPPTTRTHTHGGDGYNV